MEKKIYLYERNGHLHFSTSSPASTPKSRLVQTASFEVVQPPSSLPNPQNSLFVEDEVIDGRPFVNDYIRIYNVVTH